METLPSFVESCLLRVEDGEVAGFDVADHSGTQPGEFGCGTFAGIFFGKYDHFAVGQGGTFCPDVVEGIGFDEEFGSAFYEFVGLFVAEHVGRACHESLLGFCVLRNPLFGEGTPSCPSRMRRKGVPLSCSSAWSQ